MKAADYRKLSYADLGEKLAEAKEELFNLRFQLATNQMENTAQLGLVKKEIARINTIMREQELAAYFEQEAAQ